MDDIKKYHLEKQWESIVDDLDANDIVDKLYSKQAISAQELQIIRNEPEAKQKTVRLLKFIEQKDNKAFNSLIEVLDSEYPWLSKQLQSGDEELSEKIEQELFQDTLVLGDVPRKPRHYVSRTAPLQHLQDLLISLLPCQRIVLHGMTGSGKSCLAAAAVKDHILLRKYFSNRVYWINLGDVKDVDQLPFHMNLLYKKLLSDVRESSAKRPVSIVQEGNTDTEIRLLKDALKNVFRTGLYKNALLVLDDVSLKDATEAFDVGCKTLITTQMKDIIIGNNTEYLLINNGFTEEETLQLFAKCLDTDVKILPIYASRIHELCKGEPILISLIGSLLEPYKEQLLDNTEHWKYYIEKLTKKDYNFKVQLFGAIRLSIDRLPSELRSLYQHFAVFVEDINITPQVMQTIWKMDNKMDVQDIMTQLQNKSLIVSYYNHEMKTYVYGIHDLFLAFLRQNTSAQQMIDQHRKLISAYKSVCRNDFSKLPNDNYIFQYIGYHLKAAQLYDDFKIYFDLEFIGAKIRAIGIADLLKDFFLYNKYITKNDPILSKKLDEYIQFVKSKGYDLHKYQDTNLIQCGLGQNKEGCIYRTALHVAKSNAKNLYFQLQAPQESQYFTHTLDLQQNVSAACFTTDANLILVGMEDGNIALWQQEYHQKLRIFFGHSARITYLQLNPCADQFLSVSEDGCVKVWNLDEVVNQNLNGDMYDQNGFDKAIPSPRIKQPNWKNFYGNSERIDYSKTCELISNKLISASFANDSENTLVTGCRNGQVLIWNIVKEPEINVKINGQNEPATCVTFSNDDLLVIYASGANIYVHEVKSGDLLCQFNNQINIKSLLTVPVYNTSLVVITDKNINMWTWKQVGLQILEQTVTELDKREQAQYLCGAVTDDGMYLVAGSTDYYIRVWQINTKEIIQEILNNKGLIVCLDTFYDDNQKAVHILLSGSDDKTVKQWQIQPALKTTDTAKLLPIFDCFWYANSSIPRIAAVAVNNKVQVMNGYDLLVESVAIQSPIKVVRFSLCGNKVALGLENGEVVEFDYKTRSYKKLMSLHDSVVHLKYFYVGNEDLNLDNVSKSHYAENEVILVGTAQNGWVSVYKNQQARCLVQPLQSNLKIKQLPVIPIVQCFYIKLAKEIISVSENRTIKLWNMEDCSCEILYGDKIHQTEKIDNIVTMAVMSQKQNLLAVSMMDCSFEIFSLSLIENKIVVKLNQSKKLDSPLMCCRFSNNDKILALGQNNGNILIWSIESKTVINTMHLHKSSVSYLLFSPTPALILISVGDQIGWWDLTKLPNSSHSNFRRRYSNTAKKRSLTIDAQQLPSHFNFGLWNDKEGTLEKPHLLSSIRVRGISSKYISASYDFTSFFTIDKYGHLYIMDMLK